MASPPQSGINGAALSLWKSATIAAANAAATAVGSPVPNSTSRGSGNGNNSLTIIGVTDNNGSLSAGNSPSGLGGSMPSFGRMRSGSGARPASRPSSRPASPTRTNRGDPGTPSGRAPSLFPSMNSSSSSATLSVMSDSSMSTPPQRRSLGPSGGSTAGLNLTAGSNSDERKRSRRTPSQSTSSAAGLLDADAFFKLAKEKIDAVHRRRLTAAYVTPQTTLQQVIERLIAAQVFTDVPHAAR
jgi:hypothetical protein